MLARDGGALLIDGDPQASAVSWAAWRREAEREPSPTTTALHGKAILQEGKGLASGFTHTVVDAGGRDSQGLRSALLLSQRAIVPVVELAKEYNEGLQVSVLFTRIDPRTKDAAEMLDYLAEEGLDVLEGRICERVAFRRAIGEGAIVQEVGTDRLSAMSCLSHAATPVRYTPKVPNSLINVSILTAFSAL